jgi:anti-anti-sigma factor
MNITETKLNAATVLSLAGRLDGIASPGLEQKVELLFTTGVRQLVFDCAKLDYASSAGLRVFLTAAKRLKAGGGKVAFAALTPAVRELFELSGFVAVLSVYPTVAAAAAPPSP